MTSRMMTVKEKQDLTWQAFQDPFFTNYFPPNVKEAMESDFMRIAQHPNETITEYEERFVRFQDLPRMLFKTRVIVHASFEKDYMSILDTPTYAQVVEGAQHLEQIHDEQLRIWEDKRKKRYRNEANLGNGRKPSSDAKRRSLGGSGQV
ncbi:hypothetical protein RJ640_022465 [Escallonia rubra]|uniref:Retrotransposon gag domain-containing protein n=1 Tax=Escallonia rubra TaxID=112253 RepID=A0AA88UMY8_9ASTE|nr:hypothetical protein RJ640_022465 [Escallonia rubra]